MILDEPDDELCERLAVAYDDVRRETGVTLYPGVKRALRSLGKRFRLGLFTNGSTEMQWPKLRALGIEPCFDAIVVAGDHGLYKPDAAAFRVLATALGCPTERVLFVGNDYETDVRGARNAGMRAAWIRHPGAEAGVPPCHDLAIASIDELEGGVP